MTLNKIFLTHPNKMVIWLTGVFFLLFQFFLQLSSGLVIGAIMHEQQLSALLAGLLSSSFYYIYTSLQIPVGLLFDRYNTRTLLVINAILCSIGCFLFAFSNTLWGLFLGRLIIGGGSAFAFVGLSHLLRQHFPLRQYAFMVGLSETLGFSLTVSGIIGMGSLINHLGWRFFINSTGFIGLMIALLCWMNIPDSTLNKPIHHPKTQLLTILKNKLAWFNGIFVGLEFSVITVFGALWSVPFIQLKLHCDVKIASIVSSMILLGAGLSCPIFGQISIHLTQRKPLIHLSCWLSALLLVIALYWPTQNALTMSWLLFTLGLCCGAYMLAFSISNELAPTESLSTCTGFTNTLAMTSAPLLQPLVGLILDKTCKIPGHYSLEEYQTALLVVPAALILASLFSHFLPEKPNHQDRIKTVKNDAFTPTLIRSLD